MTFDIREHKHRYAAWAASRASSVKGCRFSVLQGKLLLERMGLESIVDMPQQLPSVEDIDEKHREWRNSLITEAEKMGLVFSHGVAAKLLNMYLKTLFVCGGHETNAKVAALHPPIDALLLKELRKKNVGGFKEHWKRAEKRKWSKFKSEHYEEVIIFVRKSMGGEPLWKVERYWQGYQ